MGPRGWFHVTFPRRVRNECRAQDSDADDGLLRSRRPDGGRTCVDLDGSSGRAGTLIRQFELRAGARYEARFDLAGNRRQSAAEAGNVTFGTALVHYLLEDTQTRYVGYSLALEPVVSGQVTPLFSGVGRDFGGAILDNVTIEQHTVVASTSVGLLGVVLQGLAMSARRPRTQVLTTRSSWLPDGRSRTNTSAQEWRGSAVGDPAGESSDTH